MLATLQRATVQLVGSMAWRKVGRDFERIFLKKLCRVKPCRKRKVFQSITPQLVRKLREMVKPGQLLEWQRMPGT